MERLSKAGKQVQVTTGTGERLHRVEARAGLKGLLGTLRTPVARQGDPHLGSALPLPSLLVFLPIPHPFPLLVGFPSVSSEPALLTALPNFWEPDCVEERALGQEFKVHGSALA